LREFNLQLPLPRPGTTGEDVEDELGTVDDLTVERAFQVALLGGREVVVEDNQTGMLGLGALAQFLDFARPDESRSQGPLARLENRVQDFGPGALGEGGKFPQGFLRGVAGMAGCVQAAPGPALEFQADQQSAFPFGPGIQGSALRFSGGGHSGWGNGARRGRGLGCREAVTALGHDHRRDCVLKDELLLAI
jgi:hypothetical protein